MNSSLERKQIILQLGEKTVYLQVRKYKHRAFIKDRGDFSGNWEKEIGKEHVVINIPNNKLIEEISTFFVDLECKDWKSSAKR